MLSSAARVSTSGTLVQDTCLRKRHRSDQSKGFSCDSKTADPLSMPTAGKSSQTHYQKIKEETKQMGNGFCKNLLISLASLSDKGGPIRHHQSPLPPIFARLSTSEVGRAKKDDDWLVRNQGNFLPFSPKGKWHFYENAIFIYFPVYYWQKLSEFWGFWMPFFLCSRWLWLRSWSNSAWKPFRRKRWKIFCNERKLILRGGKRYKMFW